MYSLDDNRVEFNSKVKVNFDGGDLSSDTGLLLLKDFMHKLGFENVASSVFKTNDTATFRYHTDFENLMQEIFLTFAGYFRDDDADELTHEPIFSYSSR